MKVAFPVAPEPDPEQAEAARQLFAGPVDFVKGVVAMSGLPPADRPEVCFAGRSNVGKSSLINAITGRKSLARASNTPGRTQEINYFSLGEQAYLVDLPGYGFAKASEDTRKTWSQLVGGYIAQRPNMVGLVIVMDARRPFMPTDEWLIEFMAGRPNVRMHWLLNKADQLKNQERRTTLRNAQKRAAEIGVDRKTISRRLPHIYNIARRLAQSSPP